MKRLLLTLLVVIGLLALVVTSCGGDESPSDVLKNFLNAVDDNNYEKSCSYLSQDILDNFSQSYFDDGVDYFHNQDGIKRITINEEEIAEDQAEVYFEVEYNNGESEEAYAYLIKEDGKWKLAEV